MSESRTQAIAAGPSPQGFCQRPVTSGARHWEIFVGLCRQGGIKGNLVPDAYLAALAIESGSEWITTDRAYSRFSGLRWRDPAA